VGRGLPSGLWGWCVRVLSRRWGLGGGAGRGWMKYTTGQRLNVSGFAKKRFLYAIHLSIRPKELLAISMPIPIHPQPSIRISHTLPKNDPVPTPHRRSLSLCHPILRVPFLTPHPHSP
jgi:hypothetical protein